MTSKSGGGCCNEARFELHYGNLSINDIIYQQDGEQWNEPIDSRRAKDWPSGLWDLHPFYVLGDLSRRVVHVLGRRVGRLSSEMESLMQVSTVMMRGLLTSVP